MSERSPSAAKERAEADVYEILVTLAGAAEDESSQSQFHAFWLNRGDLREYRFMGELGFGGKFRCDSRGESWRVECYPEDSTYHRKEIIQDTNSGLATLEAECVAADRLPDPAEVCPDCGNVRGVADPTRFACSDCWDALPVSAAVSPAEPPEAKLARYRLTVIFEASNDREAEIVEESATNKIAWPVIDSRLEKLL